MSESNVENNLKEMVHLFEADGWDGWATFFRDALSLYKSGKLAECGRHILGGSGGMGSLNDVVLGQATDNSGKLTWKPNYKESNERYNKLLDALYNFAHQTKRIK